MAELRLEGVSKTYPSGLVAVGNVSRTVADGELVVLVGPSGCGKSTILRMFSGLETVTEGRILLTAARSTWSRNLPHRAPAGQGSDRAG
jgi:ABC-type sugar transport system ATPase subunit